MRGIHLIAIALQAALVWAMPTAATARAADVVPVEPLEAKARRAGLRVLESDHLILATDRPARDGDGVADLPRVFDEAFAAWCGHYRLPPESLASWRAFGCLVVDRERFRAAGLLPDVIPEFVNGFCDRNQFWLMDQTNPAYRRHLLLHEGVHAFTLTVRGLATPTWYNEGIAEYLATHRLEVAGNVGRYVPTPMPDRASDVEQLGRIENLRELHAAGRSPSLAEVLAAPPGHHTRIADYASSWAAVAMFAGHPAYAPAFRDLECGPLDAGFNTRLTSIPGYASDRSARDFDAFIDDLDYGYDFARSAVDWSVAPPLDAPRKIAVVAGRGWQHSGCGLVKAGRYRLEASGRCTIGAMQGTTIETDADGISLDWYRGRPLGRLLAAQWVDQPAGGGRPTFVILGEGAETAVTAVIDGPLYLKLNEPPGSLADDKGSLAVDLRPAQR